MGDERPERGAKEVPAGDDVGDASDVEDPFGDQDADDDGEEDPEAARLRAATGVFAAPFADDVLSPRQRLALAAASRTLIDTWLDDLAQAARAGWRDEPPHLAASLPPPWRAGPTEDFARRYFLCLATIVWKLGQERWLLPACRAEELALDAIVREAEGQLGRDRAPRGGTPWPEDDLGGFTDAAQWDTDFAFMFDPAFADIDQTAAGRLTGMGSFDLADAFRPFAEHEADADLFPHPYARGYIGARGRRRAK